MFENVEYKGLYNFDQPFTVRSKKAFILEDDPEIVYMTDMRVTLHMSGEKMVIITSDEGSYNKVSYDCTFLGNVVANDGKTTIFADNMDLLTSKDFATIYNNVVLNNEVDQVVDQLKKNKFVYLGKIKSAFISPTILPPSTLSIGYSSK